MPTDMSMRLGALAHQPEFQQATSNINQELVDRRNYQPPVCEAFTFPYTTLAAEDNYRFDTHQEARRLLPHIINNTVVSVRGKDAVAEADSTRFHKQRNIGIVFFRRSCPGWAQCYRRSV